MKAGLVISINVILWVAGVATADECYELCADVKNSVSFKSGCSPFRNSLPRPKVLMCFADFLSIRHTYRSPPPCGAVLVMNLGLEFAWVISGI